MGNGKSKKGFEPFESNPCGQSPVAAHIHSLILKREIFILLSYFSTIVLSFHWIIFEFNLFTTSFDIIIAISACCPVVQFQAILCVRFSRPQTSGTNIWLSIPGRITPASFRHPSLFRLGRVEKGLSSLSELHNQQNVCYWIEKDAACEANQTVFESKYHSPKLWIQDTLKWLGKCCCPFCVFRIIAFIACIRHNSIHPRPS